MREGSSASQSENSPTLEDKRRLFVELLTVARAATPDQKEHYRDLLAELIRDGAISPAFLVNTLLPQAGYGAADIEKFKNQKFAIGQILDLLVPLPLPLDTIPLTETNDLLVPPVPGTGPQTGAAAAGEFSRKELPRTALLQTILQKLNIPLAECQRIERVGGKNPDEVFRKKSYSIVSIPRLEKMVLICDEHGNATYIIHALSADLSDFYSLTKQGDLKLLAREPWAGGVSTEQGVLRHLVTEVDWPKDAEELKTAIWTKNITAALSLPSEHVSVPQLRARLDELHQLFPERDVGGQTRAMLIEEFIKESLTAEEQTGELTTEIYERFLREYDLPPDFTTQQSFSTTFYNIRHKLGLVKIVERRRLTPTENVAIKAFLNGLSDEELSSGDAEARYQAALKATALRPEDISANSLGNYVARIRKERRVDFEKRRIPGAVAKVKAFISALSDHDLKIKTALQIYQDFLKAQAVQSDEFTLEQFSKQATNERRRRNIESANVVSQASTQKVLEFFDTITPEDLVKDTGVVYAQFVSKTGLVHKDYSHSAFNQRLIDARRAGELKSERAQIGALFKKFIATQSVAALQSENWPALFNAFREYLNSNGREKLDYSYAAFRTRLARL